MDQQVIIIAYLISNAVGVLFLISAWKKPRLARFMFLLLFGWASWFNYHNARQNPESYLSFGSASIPIYTEFINGWFKNHINGFVTFIAIGQGLIALGLSLKGIWVKLACIGVIIFLAGIAPLGLNSAFPFSITVSIAAYFILKKDDGNYLWRFNQDKTA